MVLVTERLIDSITGKQADAKFTIERNRAWCSLTVDFSRQCNRMWLRTPSSQMGDTASEVKDAVDRRALLPAAAAGCGRSGRVEAAELGDTRFPSFLCSQSPTLRNSPVSFAFRLRQMRPCPDASSIPQTFLRRV